MSTSQAFESKTTSYKISYYTLSQYVDEHVSVVDLASSARRGVGFPWGGARVLASTYTVRLTDSSQLK